MSLVGDTSLLSHGQPPAYLTFASLTALGLPNATTTRHCPGVASFDEPIPGSPFRGDAIRMLTEAGLDLARVSYAKQVHGAEAAQAPAGGGFAGTVDILVTVEPRAPLAIFTADCLAIILYDPEVPALGAAPVTRSSSTRTAGAVAAGWSRWPRSRSASRAAAAEARRRAPRGESVTEPPPSEVSL